MELTDDNRTVIRELLTNSQHTYVYVETDYDIKEPKLKQDTLYLPPYNDYYSVFSDIHGVEQFDCRKLDMYVENWGAMFKGCKDLKSVIFPDVDMEYVYAGQLFKGCPSLETLDMSNIVAEAFDACYMVDNDTTLTEVRMPAMTDCNYCLPNTNIRIVMDKKETYKQTLNSLIYGRTQGKGPTFVIPHEVFKQMDPYQYEHLSDKFTIEVI